MDVLAYHERSKHRLERYARGPGRLDWANQPDPFRTFENDQLTARGGHPSVMIELVDPFRMPSVIHAFT